MILYAVKDAKVGFNAPFSQPNDEVAERTFKITTKDHEYKEDLELWKVGEMDEKTGKIKEIDPEFMKGGVENV